MTGLLYGSLGGAWCGITMVWWLLDERVRWRARHTQAQLNDRPPGDTSTGGSWPGGLADLTVRDAKMASVIARPSVRH